MNEPNIILRVSPARKNALKMSTTSRPSMKMTASRRASLVFSRDDGQRHRMEISPPPFLNLRTETSRMNLDVYPTPAAKFVVQFGFSSGSSSSSSFSVRATVPSSSDGEDGDCTLVTSNGGFYFKAGGVWALVGKLGTVTDSEVTFVTPTAGIGTAQLSTV